MAESEEPTNPTPEEPKLEESKPTPAPAASQEHEKAQPSKSQEAEKAPAPKSQEDEKAPAPKADAVKPAKKPAKQKKEQSAPAARASENLSLSAGDDEKPKVVKAKGSKNDHSGIAHELSTFNNATVRTSYRKAYGQGRSTG